jgi:hypothetical protein
LTETTPQSTETSANDLAASLIAADAADREQLLRSADTDELSTALQSLGHRRDVTAAEVLAMVDNVVDDRALRKVARRELHRLRSMGIEPPAAQPASSPPSTEARPQTLAVSEAWGTDIDPTGARALWLVAERPLGGIWFTAALLNETSGLQDLSMVESTRKRFRRDFEASRGGATAWVSLPGDYSLRLIREAVDLTREVGGGLPTRYQAFREVFGEAPGPPDRGLIYETISPVEVNFNPDWLAESPRLLAEEEVAGWYVAAPAELRTRTLEVAHAPTVGLLVPGHTPEQQALQLVSDAARETVTPGVRRGLRRRLEETGYIFLQSDRLGQARLAAAAARGLDETSGVAPERHPLVRMLIASGLARLTGAELVGSRRASEVLLELVERAAQQESQAGPVETRPSGLILPR